MPAVWPFRPKHQLPPVVKSGLGREILKVLALLGVLAALVYFFRHGGNFIRRESEPAVLMDTHIGSNERQEICGPPSQGARPVAIEMVYSEDLRRWIEPATDQYSRLCPGSQVKLTPLPDIEAADAILSGRVHPTLWAPTDELSLRYLEHRWPRRGDELPFARTESIELVHSPLVVLIWQDRLRLLSALLRETPSPEGQWVRGVCAGIARDPDMTGLPQERMMPGTWADWYAPLLAPVLPPGPRRKKDPLPAVRSIGDEPLPTLEEVSKWGAIKIGHSRPSRDAAGLAALYLMTYDYVLPPAMRHAEPSPAVAASPADLGTGSLTDLGTNTLTDLGTNSPADLGTSSLADLAPRSLADPGVAPPSPRLLADSADAPAAHRFADAYGKQKLPLRKWLRRCEAGLDLAPRAANQLTANLFNVGTSLYDGVVTYEHLALPYLDRVDASAALRRLVVLYPEPTLLARHPAVLFRSTPAQRAAAERWLKFLLSKPMQQAAIEAGFRPVGTQVTIRSYDAEATRFLRLRRYGVLVQPVLKEAPRTSGKIVQSLIELWGEVTGRN